MNTFSLRRILRALGLTAAGVTVGTVGGSDAIFAKQFACEGQQVRLPQMVYDAALQMMVDPATRQPIYGADWKVAQQHLPTVTAGCKDCPKCDDY